MPSRHLPGRCRHPNPELRAKFSGEPEFVENFFEYIAEEVRELLAELGFQTLDEAIGQVEMLDTTEAVDHWKAEGLDLSPILHLPEIAREARRHQWKEQDHGLELALDQTLIQLAEGALQDGRPVTIDTPIRNVNRTVGTLLGHEVTKAYGARVFRTTRSSSTSPGRPATASARSFPRDHLRLEGDANDYVGKGLSGGASSCVRLARPHSSPKRTSLRATSSATAPRAAKCSFAASWGSGSVCATPVPRWSPRVGDHACEYMTGGRAVVLGPTGRNFAAGMSGGIAFVYDPDGMLPQRTNHEMVALEQPDTDDLTWLRERVELHGRETDSAVAGRLLADWDAAAAAFVKVMPTDFKRVLEAAAAARAEGRDETEAVMAAARA